MDKKAWKKTKKTGGFKRKLKKEYNDFINNWRICSCVVIAEGCGAASTCD